MSWKVVLIVVGAVVGLMVLSAVVGLLVLLRYRREQPSKREVLKPEGERPGGRALIIYQPGGSGFAERVAYALGEAFRSLGWEAVLDRPNKETETDLARYDLLCLGSPTWAARPQPPVTAYVERCAGLEGKPAAVFATGAQTPEEANKLMAAALEKRGARVVGTLELLTRQDGEEATGLAKGFAGKLVESAGK